MPRRQTIPSSRDNVIDFTRIRRTRDQDLRKRQCPTWLLVFVCAIVALDRFARRLGL